MRICVIYDCLYPYTIGGAERWYRNLAERLVSTGHDVTYLTMRQWLRAEQPTLDGVNVVAVAPRMGLYTDGRRRIVPPLMFGAGVLRHLLREGGRYEVVHTASFPYFSLLAVGLARRVHRFRLFVDWHEVWTRDYWRQYLGRAGWFGWRIQRRCVRIPQRAFCFSRLHERRLRAEGFTGEVTVLEGEFAGSPEAPTPTPAEPLVVFAGRHIPEKRVQAIPPAVALARERLPALRAEIYGDGPDRPGVLRLIRELGLDEAVEAPGVVDEEGLRASLARALCLVLPSQREGYGLIVVEAASVGTPSVVVAGEDNAATELVTDGINGVVARSAAPEDLSDAIIRVHQAPDSLRNSTTRWFAANLERLSLGHSLETIVASYEG
jgi:glycosyltransferase involved in cell wall biosynthesis